MCIVRINWASAESRVTDEDNGSRRMGSVGDINVIDAAVKLARSFAAPVRPSVRLSVCLSYIYLAHRRHPTSLRLPPTTPLP